MSLKVKVKLFLLLGLFLIMFSRPFLFAEAHNKSTPMPQEMAEEINKIKSELREDPNNLRLQRKLAQTYMAGDKIEKAVSMLENLTNKEPANPMDILYLAHAYRFLGKSKKAINEVKKLQSYPGFSVIIPEFIKNPIYPEKLLKKRRVCSSEDRKKIREIRKKCFSSTGFFSVIKCEKPKIGIDEYVSAAKALLKLDPEAWDIRLTLAGRYNEEGMKKKAKQELFRIISSTPRWITPEYVETKSQVFLALSEIYKEEGDMKKAAKYRQKFEASPPYLRLKQRLKSPKEKIKKQEK